MGQADPDRGERALFPPPAGRGQGDHIRGNGSLLRGTHGRRFFEDGQVYREDHRHAPRCRLRPLRGPGGFRALQDGPRAHFPHGARYVSPARCASKVEPLPFPHHPEIQRPFSGSTRAVDTGARREPGAGGRGKDTGIGGIGGEIPDARRGDQRRILHRKERKAGIRQQGVLRDARLFGGRGHRTAISRFCGPRIAGPADQDPGETGVDGGSPGPVYIPEAP